MHIIIPTAPYINEIKSTQQYTQTGPWHQTLCTCLEEEGWWVKKLRCFFAKYLYIITTRVVGSSFVSYCRNIRMVAAIYKCLSCHSLTSLVATTLLLNTIYCICVLYYILSSISNLVMCETMRQYIYVVKIITHNNL